MDPFLSLCPRLTGDSGYYHQLNIAAKTITDWPTLIKDAEKQGLQPLLYKYLKQANVPLSPTVKTQLQGLYLQHRRANQIRATELAKILRVYKKANIPVLVLKGAALAHLIYPEPGLRPMGDIDLLVSKSHARQAQQLLAPLGFKGHLPPANHLPDKHLLAVIKETPEIDINVEIHHNLFNKDYPASATLETLIETAMPFTVAEETAYTLSYEAMLWHLCHHIAYHTTVWKPTRLIWVADIVGFAEKFASVINWEKITQHYPFILNTLSLFHFISPLSDNLLNLAPIKIGPKPQGIGLNFEGWPHRSLAKQRHKGYKQIIIDSFYPPEWWLRLRYGVGSASPLWWYRWVRHPLHIGGWLLDYWIKNRLGK